MMKSNYSKENSFWRMQFTSLSQREVGLAATIASSVLDNA